MTAVELRVAAGTVDFDGYALRYDAWYPVYGGPEHGGWDEMVEAGAAARNVGDDVRLVLNHEGTPLARTAAGTMRLSSDQNGLRVRAPGLDLRNPRVQELVSASERGDLNQMSFRFMVDVDRDTWNGDFTKRRIGGFREISDVSTVTYPASPTTSFGVRGLEVARALVLDAGLDDEAIESARAAASASRLKYGTRPPSAAELRIRRVCAR